MFTGNVQDICITAIINLLLLMFRTVSACTGSAATGTTRWLAAASARRALSRYQWTASPVTRKVYKQIVNNSILNTFIFSAVQKVRGLHVSCNTDDDCKRSEVR